MGTHGSLHDYSVDGVGKTQEGLWDAGDMKVLYLEREHDFGLLIIKINIIIS